MPRRKRNRVEMAEGGAANQGASSADDRRQHFPGSEVNEGGVRCLVTEQLAKTPGSNPGFFNPVMRTNRDLSVCAVAAAAATLHPRDLPDMRCLDAFASSGILGLRWVRTAAPILECSHIHCSHIQGDQATPFPARRSL